jgi:hypothetical protein
MQDLDSTPAGAGKNRVLPHTLLGLTNMVRQVLSLRAGARSTQAQFAATKLLVVVSSVRVSELDDGAEAMLRIGVFKKMVLMSHRREQSERLLDMEGASLNGRNDRDPDGDL